MSTTNIDIVWPKIDPQKLRTVLTVAGSDSSGGAGIEADIKSITANHAYALTAITTLTAQNTTGVEKVTNTDKESLEAIFHANFTDLDIDVIKTGLLTLDAVNVLAKYIKKYHISKPFVIDPVLVATTGAQLGKADILRSVIDKLTPFSTLLTPNLIEAHEILKLTDSDIDVNSISDIKEIARLIHEKTGALNVLVKGGHIPWTRNDTVSKDSSESVYVTDVLYSSFDSSFKIFRSDYIDSENTHGTGCTLASSISANLANGFSIANAVETGIRYVHGAIVSTSKIGHGHGPLNHLYNIVPIATTSPLKNTTFTEGHFVDYLISHPSVKGVWNLYVNHPFVEQVSNGSLERRKFIRFLEQDYPYLVHYARIHSLATSVAPDLKCIDREIAILGEIKHELSLHTEKLKNHGITDLESLSLSEAGKAYADYLMDVAKGGDWLEINVALSPCLIGYRQAALNVNVTTDDAEYQDWISSYTSDWYRNAVESGRQTIERHSVGISLEKASKLVQIFADVSLLEVNFWNDALNF